MRKGAAIFAVLVLGLGLFPVPSPAGDAEEGAVRPLELPGSNGAKDQKFFITPPPLSEDTWPCSDCHDDQEVNPERRVLEDMHEDIQLINHDEENRWCLDCHNPDDRDKLRLASGRLITFQESHLLCGQCHGTIFRDWKAGVHGKRTGEWNGKKVYRLCVSCHNPHQPRFKPLTPEPPPVKPKNIK